MEKDEVIYSKKTKHLEFTLSRTTRKEKIEGLIALALLAGLLWYFFIR